MSRSVVIVDDDDVARFLCRAVEECGFTVHLFQDVDEVVAFISEGWPVSAFVLDCVMPPGSLATISEDGLSTGLVLSRRIRAHYPTAPIVILTARSDAVVLAEQDTDTSAHVMSKGELSPSNLASTLQRLVARSEDA